MDIKLPLITRAKLVLTEECQLRCSYCYEKHGHRSMSLDTAKKIIEYIFSNAKSQKCLPSITFFGGEPLLVFDELMKPCIEYIRSELKVRCNIGFTTNGLLLTEERLKYLKSMDVHFMLSIDGCPESHDVHRLYPDDSKSSEELVKLVPTILKYFPNTMARMTLTPENLPYLYQSVRYIQELGFTDMHIVPNLFVPTDKLWSTEDMSVARAQLSLVRDYIIDTFEEDNVPLVFRTLADMFPRIVLANYSKRVNHHRVASCCSPIHRCGIGVLNNVTFDIDGNLFSCQHGSSIPEESNVFYLGNIGTGIVEDRRLHLLELNEKPLVSETLDCSQCPLNDVCTGGCVPNNYVVTGEFTKVPESYCLWTQELYNAALSIIEHFDKKQDNMLFKDYFYGVVKRGVLCVC